MAGVGVNDETFYGTTALQLAARGKYDKTQNLLSLLVQCGADVNRVDSDGETALFRAVEFGTTESVQFLIDNRVNIQIVSEGAQTALTIAVACNRYDIIRILLECGAETRHLDEFNINASLGHIANYGDCKTIEIFTTREIKGIDPFRKPIPPGKTPQQLFNERNPTPELRRAFEILIASLVKNGGPKAQYSSLPDDESSDDEFVDAEEELEHNC